VLGVSRDSLKSHEKFRAAQSLNFPLLSDPECVAHTAFGAWGKKIMYGKEVEGTIRSTFLIDRSGIVRRAWTKVKVDGHVDEVMAALEAL
jgi:peroxiredoxin Q/BCP